MLLVGATYHAETLKLTQGRSLQLITRCFDVRELLQDFWHYHKDNEASNKLKDQSRRVDLGNLDAFKFFGMIMVILFHSFFMEVFYAPDLLRANSDITKSP